MYCPLQVELKPATDVLAGAVARAASQGTIHPLDTLKVRLQTRGGKAPAVGLSKISKLLPPAGQPLDNSSICSPLHLLDHLAGHVI